MLEFHILADDLQQPTEYQKMVEQLKNDGPRPQAGDKTKWFEVESRTAWIEFTGRDGGA